jgi:hypothetical protein
MALAEPLDRSVLSTLGGFAAMLGGGLACPVTTRTGTAVVGGPAATIRSGPAVTVTARATTTFA